MLCKKSDRALQVVAHDGFSNTVRQYLLGSDTNNHFAGHAFATTTLHYWWFIALLQLIPGVCNNIGGHTVPVCCKDQTQTIDQTASTHMCTPKLLAHIASTTAGQVHNCAPHRLRISDGSEEAAA